MEYDEFVEMVAPVQPQEVPAGSIKGDLGAGGGLGWLPGRGSGSI